jgi:8-oxo-dGTP pyrophosphatase MutT (NUDIX family)
MAGPRKPDGIAPWQVLESKYSYRDRWLAVRTETVRLPNGTILSPYHTLEFPEWVSVIALTPSREIVLVEQYRHGIKRLSVELPSGNQDDPAEDMLDAARREFREETGYAAEEWHRLGSATTNTSRQSNRLHFFLALDARKVTEQALDPGEMIDIRFIPWTEFLADVTDGTLEIPGHHLAGLWKLRAFAKRTADPRLLALNL